MQSGRRSPRRARVGWTLALAAASMVFAAGPASATPPDAGQRLSLQAAETPMSFGVAASPPSGSPDNAQADVGRSPRAAPKVIRQNQAVRETGKTYGEWSAAWWQYVLSIPQSQNPLLDATGALCGQGQSGPVFFLVGTFTTEVVNGDVFGTANRSQCTAPAGKPLFIPILNAECSTVEGNGTTEAQLRECAHGFVNNVTELSLEVDGKK